MKKFSLTLKFFSSMESLTEKFQFTILFSLELKIFVILNLEKFQSGTGKFQSIFGLKFFNLVKAYIYG